MQFRHPLPDRQPIYLIEGDIVSLFDLQQVGAELVEITRVIPERMLAHITLVFQVL